STFHSMCVRILRRDIERIGYSRNFSIIDGTDQRSVMKQILKNLNLDPKQYDPRAMLNHISNAKNELITTESNERHQGKYYISTKTQKEHVMSRITLQTTRANLKEQRMQQNV